MSKKVRLVEVPTQKTEPVEVEQKVVPSEKISKMITEVRNIDLDISELTEILKNAKAKKETLMADLETFAVELFPQKEGQKRFGDGIIGYKLGSEAVKVEGNEKDLVLIFEIAKKREYLNISAALDRKKITEFLKIGKTNPKDKDFVFLTKNGISLGKTPKFFVE